MNLGTLFPCPTELLFPIPPECCCELPSSQVTTLRSLDLGPIPLEHLAPIPGLIGVYCWHLVKCTGHHTPTAPCQDSSFYPHSRFVCLWPCPSRDNGTANRDSALTSHSKCVSVTHTHSSLHRPPRQESNSLTLVRAQSYWVSRGQYTCLPAPWLSQSPSFL